MTTNQTVKTLALRRRLVVMTGLLCLAVSLLLPQTAHAYNPANYYFTTQTSEPSPGTAAEVSYGGSIVYEINTWKKWNPIGLYSSVPGVVGNLSINIPDRASIFTNSLANPITVCSLTMEIVGVGQVTGTGKSLAAKIVFTADGNKPNNVSAADWSSANFKLQTKTTYQLKTTVILKNKEGNCDRSNHYTVSHTFTAAPTEETPPPEPKTKENCSNTLSNCEDSYVRRNFDGTTEGNLEKWAMGVILRATVLGSYYDADMVLGADSNNICRSLINVRTGTVLLSNCHLDTFKERYLVTETQEGTRLGGQTYAIKLGEAYSLEIWTDTGSKRIRFLVQLHGCDNDISRPSDNSDGSQDVCYKPGNGGAAHSKDCPTVTSSDTEATIIQKQWVCQLRRMTAQLASASTYTTGMIGGFFDAKQMQETKDSLQRLQATAAKDYTPGENLCRIGTLTRSLAATEEQSKGAALSINRLMLNRETQNAGQSKPDADTDKIGKLETLRTLYCDPGDNDKTPVACRCDMEAGTCSTSDGPIARRSNRDLDFARLWQSRLTLDINYNDATMTADEQDVLAFLANVVAPDLPINLMNNQLNLKNHPGTAYAYLNLRSLFAARSTIRHSLSNQLARKAPGAEGSEQYMLALLKELGMTDDEAARHLKSTGLNLDRNGSSTTSSALHPSYEAQMEILTKTIYQNPNFLVNLIDKPANVDRTKAAMMAISLMQRRDLYELVLRREMLLSQLLEAGIRQEQEVTNRRLQRAKSDNQ